MMTANSAPITPGAPSPSMPTTGGGIPASHRRWELALVDDHPLVLEGLSRLVQRYGMHTVAHFVSSSEALSFLDTNDVDLLVVDLRLHGESGLDLVTHVHKRKPWIRIAVLTSYEDPVAAKQAINAGARGFLLKDALSDELARRLRSVADGDLVVDNRLADAVLSPVDVTLEPRELRILSMIAEGLTNREIGMALHLSPYTVKDHLRRSMRKLGTRTRAETVAKAAREGLLTGA